MANRTVSPAWIVRLRGRELEVGRRDRDLVGGERGHHRRRERSEDDDRDDTSPHRLALRIAGANGSISACDSKRRGPGSAAVCGMGRRCRDNLVDAAALLERGGRRRTQCRGSGPVRRRRGEGRGLARPAPRAAQAVQPPRPSDAHAGGGRARGVRGRAAPQGDRLQRQLPRPDARRRPRRPDRAHARQPARGRDEHPYPRLPRLARGQLRQRPAAHRAGGDVRLPVRSAPQPRAGAELVPPARPRARHPPDVRRHGGRRDLPVARRAPRSAASDARPRAGPAGAGVG